MRITLDYGRTGLEVQLPDDRLVGPLEIHPAPPLEDAEAVIEEKLAHPTGTPPLAELARAVVERVAGGRRRDAGATDEPGVTAPDDPTAGARSALPRPPAAARRLGLGSLTSPAQRPTACILVSDITRPVPNELLLKPILRTLEEAGFARDNILILIATGLHRPNEGDELVEILGADIAANYRVENHHGKRRDEHVYLGTTPRGVPAWIDRRWVHADLKIATGLIEPHLMAGYSGGRKLICPGIAALETVKVWHGPDFLEHPKADCGILDGNPVHEENTRIARMAGCDFIVNVTIDRQRRPTCIVAGDMEAAFLEGVRFVRPVVEARVREPVEVVVTSSAGYPLDTTFYQAVKGLTGALPIVKQGGTIVMAASLSEGIGSPEFQRLFDENADLDQFMHRILPSPTRLPSGERGRGEGGEDYFVVDQWQLEELAKVRRKARVKIVTDGLPPETLRRLFVEPAASVEQAVAESLADYGPAARVAVIPKGPYVLAMVG